MVDRGLFAWMLIWVVAPTIALAEGKSYNTADTDSVDACDVNEQSMQRDMFGIVNWTGGRTDRVISL